MRYDGKKWIGVNYKVIGSAADTWDIEPLAADNVWVAADDAIKHYDGRSGRGRGGGLGLGASFGMGRRRGIHADLREQPVWVGVCQSGPAS